MSSFLNDLSCINFDLLEIIVNPDDALKYFYNCLNNLLMEHIPIKEKQVKNRNNQIRIMMKLKMLYIQGISLNVVATGTCIKFGEIK